MAEHVWFIPASAGTENGGDFNIQWLTDKWPQAGSSATTAPAAVSVFGRHTATVEASLNVCHADWQWTSQTDGSSVTVGNQLLVGTVFAATLPTSGISLSWTNIDVWFKVRTSNKERFDSIKVSINDGGSPPTISTSGELLTSMTNNQWKILRHSRTVSSFSVLENMRAVLIALGTTDHTKVGATDLQVEWVAFRLV